MLIHAAGNPELGERAALLPSSLLQSLTLHPTLQKTDCVHGSYHGSLCSFSLSDASPAYLLAANDRMCAPPSPSSLTAAQDNETPLSQDLAVEYYEISI